MQYTNNQLLWDLHYLSFFCSVCNRRVLVGIFSKGFKTSPSTYFEQLHVIIDKHNKSNCQFMNAHNHNCQWKEYVRQRELTTPKDDEKGLLCLEEQIFEN